MLELYFIKSSFTKNKNKNKKAGQNNLIYEKKKKKYIYIGSNRIRTQVSRVLSLRLLSPLADTGKTVLLNTCTNMEAADKLTVNRFQ